ncbi:hypothetical protein [Methylobacterium phyllostachyos]|uniref:hypothetical protein n=1 Tax=Methylobacterium phyllostachyos TaxID=582672 RepID=UPI00115FCC68|nr:hypothetical protein [Methylobacterium phyllostachyos]
MDDTGESAATLQHWCNLNVLFPIEETEKQGRGRHRQFRAEPNFGERKWALIASAMNDLHVPVHEMVVFMTMLRWMADPQSETYRFGDDQDDPSEALRVSRYRSSPIGRALHKEDNACVLLSVGRKGKKTGYHWCGLDLVPRPEHIKSADWLKTPSDFTRKHSRCYLLNLSVILSPLWS